MSAPIAGRARLRPRHRAIILSFFLGVILPSFLTIGYLFVIAKDQYASSLGFSVQREDGGVAADLLGGLRAITGGTGNTPDTVILYKYVVSRDMLRAVEARVDMAEAFTRPGDPFYSLSPDAPIEEREAHWRRMVKVFLDTASGLIEIRVRTYTPETAQAIAVIIEEESAKLLNQLSETAREDATRFARADLDLATERLAEAQSALTAFRTRTQIVDPEIDFAGRLTLLNQLIAKQAEALIERDLLLTNGTSEDDPRFLQAERRIEVIGKRIEAERARIAQADDGSGAGYAELVAEYEQLSLEHQFATQTYTASKGVMASAMAKADRTTRYLAIYKPATLAEKSEFPERFIWSGIISGLAFVLWSIAVLTYYAVRDRR